MKQIIYNNITGEQIVQDVPDVEITITPEQEIKDLKQKLKDTDYKAIKYAEGQLTDEEYASTKAERQSWRDRINELEAQILAQAAESEATGDDN